MSESFSLPDTGTYEVSFWYQNNFNRLNKVKEKIDRDFAAKANKENEEKKPKKHKGKDSEKKKKKLLKKWKKICSKIVDSEKNRRLQKAKAKLDKLRKERKRRQQVYEQQIILSKTSSEFIDEKKKNEEEETTEIMINLDTPNALLWRSFAKRFMKQTQYNTLLETREQMIKEKRMKNAIRAEKWCFFAANLLQDYKQNELEIAADNLTKHKEQWSFFTNETVHENTMKRIHDEYKQYSSHKFKNPEEYQRFWRACAHYQLRKERTLTSIKVSLAMDTLNRFFNYIIIPFRCAKSIPEIKLGWKTVVKREVRKEISRSARKIKNCALCYRNQIASNFAVNFTSCISEACSSVAIYHIGRPVAEIKPPFEVNKPTKPQKKPTKKEKEEKKPKKTVPKKQTQQKPAKAKKETKKTDSATNPIVPFSESSDLYGEEETSESSSVLSQLDEHKPVEIEIDNNNKEDVPNNSNLNIQIVHICTEKSEEKPKFELIKGDTETVSPDEEQKEPVKQSKEQEKEPQKQQITKEIHLTNELNINEVIQTPKSKSSRSNGSSLGLPDEHHSPNISTLVEMYNSGSSLEPIDSSIDEIRTTDYDVSTGSPIKKQEYTEEESFLTGTPASISSIHQGTSSRSTSKRSSSSRRAQYTSSSSAIFQSPLLKSNEVNLLEENNSKIFTFDRPVGITDFTPYRIYDEYEEEEEEEEEQDVNFIFEDDYEGSNEESEGESNVPFIFNESQESIAKASSKQSTNNSSAHFVFDTSSNEHLTIKEEEEEEEEHIFHTSSSSSAPKPIPKLQEKSSTTESDRVMSFSENATESSDNGMQRKHESMPPLTPPVKEHIPEPKKESATEYYEEEDDDEEEEAYSYEEEDEETPSSSKVVSSSKA